MKGEGCTKNNVDAVRWFEMCADPEQIKRDMVHFLTSVFFW